MDFNKIFERVKNILITPPKEWDVIKTEQSSVMDLFTRYAIFLAAIPAIAGFIGWALIGFSYGFGTIRIPVGNTLLWTIFYYVLSIGGTVLLGILIDVLAPSFGATKEMLGSMKVAVYSTTAAWIAGIFFIIPSIRILVFLGGLYSIYLLYLGLMKIKGAPKDKVVGYMVVIFIIMAVIMWLVQYLAGALAFGSTGFKPF